MWDYKDDYGLGVTIYLQTTFYSLMWDSDFFNGSITIALNMSFFLFPYVGLSENVEST